MKILVVGGTGTVGREVVQRLAAQAVQAKVLTRSTEKAGTLPLDATIGDLDRPETLGPAFAGIDAAFILAAVGPNETTQALNAVTAARAAGVGRMVYLSVAMPPGADVIPFFATKRPVEQAVRESGAAWTILRPNNFFQSDLPLRDVIARQGLYPSPLGSRGLNRVDVRDVADAAVTALTKPGFEGVISLHGPRGLTGTEVARVYGEALGRPVRYAGDDLDAWERSVAGQVPDWLVAGLRSMYDYFQREGLHGSGTEFAAQQRILGRAPRTFESFVQELAPAWKALG